MIDATDERVLKAWRDWQTANSLNDIAEAGGPWHLAAPKKKQAINQLYERCSQELFDAVEALVAEGDVG